MRVPVSWLKEYVEINLPVDELAERLTLAGLEVAGLEQIGDWWEPQTLVTGQVVAVKPHPNADRLVLVDVEHGAQEVQQVVTGAPNLFQYRGQNLAEGSLPVIKVAFARRGATLVNAYSEEIPRPMTTLKPAKIRGVKSEGMVCSERELGLSEEHEGILLLPEDAPVGVPLRDYLGDTVIEIELTPDMARCLSMVGVAREVAALTNAALRLPDDQAHAQGEDAAADYVGVAIEDPALCARYTGMIIKDVTVGESPQWIQERLRKAGMRPISNIVDITNYVMLEMGQPLHAFDYDLVAQRAPNGEKPVITVRPGRPGETLETIDHVNRKLDDSMLLITDQAGPIAIAGVMGGLETEVHDATVNVLLESATFEGVNNRRTSQSLKLHSEASHRFTRGIPATLNDMAARRAAELMRLYAGGRVVPGIVDTYPAPQPQITVYLTQSEVQRQLGMALSLDQIEDALTRLDFRVERLTELPEAGTLASFGLHIAPGEPILACTAPWHRLDIAMPADLTEEVARMVGYDQVGETLMDSVLPPQRRNFVLEAEERIRDILMGFGLQDTINYALTSPENHEKLLAGRSAAGPQNGSALYIELANPLSTERRVMRRSMLVSALENLAHNGRYTERMASFEIGRIYHPEAGDGPLPAEDRRLCIALTGPRRVVNIHGDAQGGEPFDFFDAKGMVETLALRMGLDPARLRFVAHPESATFGPRCARVLLDEQPLGILGEVHPRVRAAFDLSGERVVLAELHVEPLIRRAWRAERMAAISVYPSVVEDLAFVVGEEVTVGRVRDAILASGGELLTSVELFDIYRGQNIGSGNKSLAFRLTYQSLERSLSEAEIASLRQQVIQGVEGEVGAKLRG
jgi:phenylalanyl-tRNA synthetase beta chain